MSQLIDSMLYRWQIYNFSLNNPNFAMFFVYKCDTCTEVWNNLYLYAKAKADQKNLTGLYYYIISITSCF